MKPLCCKGFTLVELVVALGLTVIVVSFSAMFLTGPVQGYTDQARRADLVQTADSALHRMSRDIHSALPNSLRTRPVGSGFALEMMYARSGARYRSSPPPADPDKYLEFAAVDTRFNVLGSFSDLVLPFSSNNHHLVVYNAGVSGADAWEMANVITPPGTQIDITPDALPGETAVTLTPAFRFAYPSPTQRVYLVSGPITWLCDPGSGTLKRYTDYVISSSQADRDTDGELIAAGADASQVAQYVGSCSADYSPGTAQRSGLVTMSLALIRDGESIALLDQTHVENAP